MKKLIILLALLLPVSCWAADWSLDGNQSTLTIFSVKKGSVGEVHYFTGLHGSIDGAKARVSIDLSTIKTGIAKRNKRMRSMLFDVSKFATATITADISKIHISTLKVGETLSATLPLRLDLHGVSKTMRADVTVVALANGGLLVNSRSPVIIKAADFGLSAGIQTLRKVAKLTSIATSVPVTFELYFSR